VLWIKKFQLFLFDFDGLLVNTEHLHFQAYSNLLANRGFQLDWTFAQYLELAHLNASAIREALYIQFPGLPDWKQLYEEKKQIYAALLSSGKVELMPGVEALLRALAEAQIRRCVVTHSSLPLTQLIRAHHPVLRTIPFWITREDYDKPKPDPECYLRAIQLHGRPGDRIIGFEDSVRGLRALQNTPALPVLICPAHHPLLEMTAEGIRHFESLEEITDNSLG
jgi:beta-phosphoglucomutase